MIQRGGQVVMHLLANVKQQTIEPFIKDTIASGTLVYTDAYSMYARLETWGSDHKRVNHGRGEYARDEDGDGFCEVQVNTMEPRFRTTHVSLSNFWVPIQSLCQGGDYATLVPP